MTRPTGDGGSASLWVLAAAALVLVIAFAGQQRALAVLARHRAEAAADLAALAAAGRIGGDGVGCAAAARVAAADGARLVSCLIRLAPSGRSGDATVRVSLSAAFAGLGTRTVIASARASRPP
jgi:secretion/DNA translocation related TadE-like protein